MSLNLTYDSGDPECQVTLPLISSDVFEMLFGAATDTLDPTSVDFDSSSSALTVVLASEGYPAGPIKGKVVHGLQEALNEQSYRHSWVNVAGVSKDDSGVLISSGGRVLSCTAMAGSLRDAQVSAYQLLNNIDLEGSHFRTDIGFPSILRRIILTQQHIHQIRVKRVLIGISDCI